MAIEKKLKPEYQIPSIDALARVFNTALVSTRAEPLRDFSTELFTLIQTPAFRAILTAIKQLALTQNLSEREAAESVISTFREVDRVWEDYIRQEGIDRVKHQIRSGP